jgi:UDP-sulfoquinovose synthase
MRVLIAGIDGYLGWPLAQHLTSRGHEVAGIDNLARRRWVSEMKSDSAVPILDPTGRRAAFS